MFGLYDHITLSLVNAVDINGKILDFSLTLPVDEEISLPRELTAVDLFEYQEGFMSGGKIVFSIYVGKKSTIDNMVDMNDGIGMKLRDEIEIPSVETPICYQVINGKKFIYAVLDDNDVVVESHDELKEVISSLSSDYKSFSESVQKIKKFNERNAK